MIVYRLAIEKYCRDLSGKGAELSGGRWNSRGTSMLYTSSSRALCLAEVAVHLPLSCLPAGYSMVSISFPDAAARSILQVENLPLRWDALPPIEATRLIGDLFIQQAKALILQVPSVVVNGDVNYLLNPHHPSYALVKIVAVESFRFDPRLFPV